MSRTHLFSHLQRALKLAAQLERQGIPTAEGIERAAEAQYNIQQKQHAQWSRRQFLQASSLAASLVMTPRWTRGAALQMVQVADLPRVVIVGAGTAGLTCAYRLQQAGISARVLEGNKRIGGRMLTLRDKLPEGQITELGGEFIDSGHTSLRNLAAELGLTLVDLREADGDLENDIAYFNKRRVPYAEIVDAFRPVATAIKADLDTLTGDDVTYDAPNGGEPLDRLSIAQWLDKHKVTGLIRSLLKVAYTTEYGLEIDQQTAFNLLYLIGTEADQFEVYGSSDERYHIAEGNDSVPTRLAAALKQPVELETRLEAIRQRSDEVYVLTVNQGGKVQDIEADEVVLALPFTMLRRVDIRVKLPPTKTLAIRTLGYGTNAKIIAGFSERVWKAVNSNGSSFSDLPYQNTWETTRGQAGTGGALTDYLGGTRGLQVLQGTVEKQAADFVAQIENVYPGAAKAYNQIAARADWPKQPFIQASYACYKPGQFTGIRGVEGEAVGRLHFAGEHTSLDSQGYMNGASESGERAASEVLESIGVQVF